jgi:hypothetical protein
MIFSFSTSEISTCKVHRRSRSIFSSSARLIGPHFQVRRPHRLEVRFGILFKLGQKCAIKSDFACTGRKDCPPRPASPHLGPAFGAEKWERKTAMSRRAGNGRLRLSCGRTDWRVVFSNFDASTATGPRALFRVCAGLRPSLLSAIVILGALSSRPLRPVLPPRLFAFSSRTSRCSLAHAISAEGVPWISGIRAASSRNSASCQRWTSLVQHKTVWQIGICRRTPAHRRAAVLQSGPCSR